MAKKTTTTTIYTEFDNEIGETCLEVLAHQWEEAQYLGNLSGNKSVILYEGKESGAQNFMNIINHAPGCRVTGHESHKE